MVYPHKWSPISYRSSAGQQKHAGQRPMFYRWTTQPYTNVKDRTDRTGHTWQTDRQTDRHVSGINLQRSWCNGGPSKTEIEDSSGSGSMGTDWKHLRIPYQHWTICTGSLELQILLGSLRSQCQIALNGAPLLLRRRHCFASSAVRTTMLSNRFLGDRL